MVNKKTLLAATALLLGAGLAYAQQKQDYSKVEIKSSKVAGNVWLLMGAGGNMAVSQGPDGKLLVDDEFKELAPKIKAAIKATGAGKLKWVVNTHYHGDHTGGNPVFGLDAPIIAQTNVRTLLENGSETAFGKTPPMEKAGLPIVTYDTQASLWINGEEVRLMYYPHGHTNSDSVVWFTKSNVVHMGDDFFNGLFPFIDVKNGGDVEQQAKTVADMASKIGDDTKVIPGHGPLGDKKALMAYGKMLEDSVALVKGKLAKGETVEQIQGEGMPDDYKSWAGGFLDAKGWLGIVAGSLQANSAGK